MTDDDRHVDIAAESFLEGMEMARDEILGLLTDNAISRFQQADPNITLEALGRKGGEFAAAVAVRVAELQAERQKLKPMARA